MAGNKGIRYQKIPKVRRVRDTKHRPITCDDDHDDDHNYMGLEIMGNPLSDSSNSKKVPLRLHRIVHHHLSSLILLYDH